jgi:hypothetical protein
LKDAQPTIKTITASLAITPISFLKAHASQLFNSIAYPTVNSSISMDVPNACQDLGLELMVHALYLPFSDALL